MKKRSNPGKINRREFIKTASATAAALSLPAILIRRSSASDSFDDPRIVVVRDQAAHQGSQIVPDIAQVVMDEAIRRYTGMADIGEAYRSVLPGISAGSVIGIKVNTLYSSLSTHPIVVNTVVNGLQKMTFGGNPFPANNIIIWDRTSLGLQIAGYTINTGPTGVRCFGTNEVGYNSIYLNCNGSQQHPSNLITDICDYLIVVGLLKNHNMAGVSLSLKNHLGSIQYPGSLHGNYCNPYIPALNQQIRDVLDVQESLFIVDAIFGAYSGGPSGPPNMIYDGIILGQDRVAVDAIGRDILDEYGCPTIGISQHVDTAAQPPYNLGTANLEEINRIEVNNPSAAVENLTVTHQHPDVILNWSTPEYTGLFKIWRSLDANFSSYDEIATLSGSTYTDPGILVSNEKYFYRVVKTWG